MGLYLRRRRGLGEDLSLASQYAQQLQDQAGDAQSAISTLAASTTGSTATGQPGSADPNNANTKDVQGLADGASTKKKDETNWLGWGLVAAGLGGLALVAMVARKQRRRGRRA